MIFTSNFKHFNNFFAVPQQHSGMGSQLFGTVCEMPICHNNTDLTAIIFLSCIDFLHGSVSQIGMIAFTLDGVVYTILARKHIHTLIATSWCNADIGETVLLKQKRTPLLKLVPGHIVNKEHGVR